jgi:hypothetical protein
MKLQNKIKSQKGAMDRIIVTLILVIISVAGIVGIEVWSKKRKNDLLLKTDNTISNILTKINSN